MTERRPATRALVAVAATAAGAGAAAIAGAQLASAPAVAAPLAASLALVLVTPAAPAARPGAVLGGYALSVASGIAVAAAVIAPAAAVTIAAAIGTALMIGTRRMHPPATAAACVIALQPAEGWQVALIILTAAAALAVFIRLRSLPRRAPRRAAGAPAAASPRSWRR